MYLLLKFSLLPGLPSHMWGRLYLPMFLLWLGLFTLIKMDSLTAQTWWGNCVWLTKACLWVGNILFMVNFKEFWIDTNILYLVVIFLLWHIDTSVCTFVCVYIYIYIYIYIYYIYIYMHACMYIHMHAKMYVRTSIHTYITYIYMIHTYLTYVHPKKHKYICMHTYNKHMHVYLHTKYIYTCITYIYTYIIMQTYIHKQSYIHTQILHISISLNANIHTHIFTYIYILHTYICMLSNNNEDNDDNTENTFWLQMPNLANWTRSPKKKSNYKKYFPASLTKLAPFFWHPVWSVIVRLLAKTNEWLNVFLVVSHQCKTSGPLANTYYCYYL